MKDSELRTRAKALALGIIAVCDEVDTRKGRGVLVNKIVRSAPISAQMFTKRIMQ